MSDEMQAIEKQAEARSWTLWDTEEWGNTQSGAHYHGWKAGRDWGRREQSDALSAAQAEVTRLTDVLAEIRDIAASDRSDVVIACTVGAWAQEALAVQPAAPKGAGSHE